MGETTKTESTPAPKAQEFAPVTMVAKQQDNTRVLKLREIFTISGKIGQTPAEMKEMIGTILKLNHPLRESSEILDDQLDTVLDHFRMVFNNTERKEAA